MVKFCATNKVGYPTIQELIYVQDVELSWRQKCIFGLSS